ncbi:MAG: pyrroline-5-carboxylate reductase [Nanoarchaeota archaeon]|nr:pyrroline-5-carboxylate reductase [Nanoarchaeota archaeon]
MRLGFIGTGKMGAALVTAALNVVEPQDIICSDENKDVLVKIEANGVPVTQDNSEVVSRSDMIFLCVKPQKMEEVIKDLKVDREKAFVSIAAGIKITLLEKMLPGQRIIRLMPTIGCIVNEMAAAYALGSNVTEEDEKALLKIFSNAGLVVKVDEKDMDVVTALTAPAYIAYIIGIMAHEAAKQGLDKETALKLACQTAVATGKLVSESTPEDIIGMVCSPGGTTEAGMRVLKGTEKSLRDTIKAAVERSKELGE